MSRNRFVLIAGLSLILAREAAAQAPSTLPAGCTYATCALRIEPEFWGPRLVRGVNGEHVGGKLTGFGGGIDPILAGPDSAARYGRAYVRDSRTSGTLGLVALAGYAVVLWRTDNFRHADSLGTEGTTAAVGGLLFGSAAAYFQKRATVSLSRAILWYNAALPR